MHVRADNRSLSHLPKSLRDKCAIVDTTKMTKEETADAMNQYAVNPKLHL